MGVPKLPNVKDAIAAAKASAPPRKKHIVTYGMDDDGNLVELDMRRKAGDRWIVIHRRKKVSS